MVVQTKSFQDYQLKGNPVTQVPDPRHRVGNLINDELGELVLARLNEEFRENNQIAYTGTIEKNQSLPFSNVPRNLYANQVIREELGNAHVLNPIEVVQYWDSILDKSDTYADSNSVSIFPNKGVNETLRERVLDLIGKQKTDLPLIVANLGVEPADNEYGFTFTETPYLEVIEAPFLEKDQRVKHDPKTKTLVPSDDDSDVYIWTPGDQSGLHRACRNRCGDLIFRSDLLLNSYGSGRVSVVQDPQGRAENLGELANKLKEERDKEIAGLEANYQKAIKVLRTGKL